MNSLKRKWKIYVIQHSHTDIGYTQRQEKIEQYQVDFIRQAVAVCNASHSGDRPEWEGFKWTCETFWAVEKFLEQATEEEKEQFVSALRRGDIELSGSYLNMTELIDYELLGVMLAKAGKFAEPLGLQVRSAMTADINGYSWGYSQALADAGIEHLLSCIHTHHGMFALGRKQYPFYWETPKGNRILVWNGEHYMVSGSLNRVTGWTVLQFIPSDRITNTFIGNTVSYALFGILALIAALALAFFFHRYFANPILKLSGAMKMVDTGNLHNVTVKTDREDEIGRLIMSYNAMIERLKSSRASEIAAGQQQKKAELKMLQAQINPHFLYNTLNAIHSISELHRIDTISTMTKSLSSLYRYNIKYGDEVTVAKELEQIDNYVKIQQIRFLNRFQVEYRVDPEVLSYKILKFLMQPIIENSFYHGLEPKGGQGLLTLTIKRQGQFLHIEVKDNGAGIAPEKLAELTAMLEEDGAATGEDADSGRHFGLRNVHTRIKHFYGDGYWMRVHSREEEGTTIEMNIPLSKEDERP